MFEAFLNPGYVALGAALVSLPILIHLINRMRFKRVPWAAMEFLLKSMKRNRRRLIIEQLLLLALRCLLVLLAMLLVSRYLGFAFAFL
jgi:succinate dehydrogenase/fumarate reductase cytochrome b subunit